MNAPLALYRRYRPDNYADMIGQEHVTEPLQRALRNNRVNHAYLFSGPRGCGKTTSARILARCLNCERGPTPTPCGECRSCVDLARGGPGSIDVIEIDAASHGGVDDARDLRERAFFSPVSSHYKIYIVDEAHMVTTQGFNALLKLVEEPPEHLKFIFATTEPDKVIGTIRSRTHHYPFRLVPPKVLSDYLAYLCEQEDVPIEAAALPLVVRAGGGSVRDTLSVLDQLIGGAGEDGVTYTHAVGLLGYTHESLLDEIVDALAAHDGGAVFACVDKVIESGQDPKRFAEDLLHRLRDLVILSAVPDAATSGLLDGPADQAERLAAQAGRFGTAALTRAASEINDGLTEMRGATAPRLHLELLCARVLLPAVDDTALGLGARLDRLERRLAIGGGGAEPAAAAPAPAPAQTSAPASAPAAQRPARAPEAPATRAPEPSAPAPAPGPAQPAPASGWDDTPAAAPPAPQPVAQPPTPQPAAQAAAEPTPAAAPGGDPGSLSITDVRRVWPDILENVKGRRRLTWSLLSANAQVTGLHGNTLTVALVNAGARDSFARSGSEDILREALRSVLGVNWRIDAIVDPSGGAGRSSGSPAPAPAPATAAAPTPATPAAPAPAAGNGNHGGEPDGWGPPQAAAGPAPRPAAARSAPQAPAKAAPRDAPQAQPAPPVAAPPPLDEPPPDPDEDIDPETDLSITEVPSTHTELLTRELGAEIID